MSLGSHKKGFLFLYTYQGELKKRSDFDAEEDSQMSRILDKELIGKRKLLNGGDFSCRLLHYKGINL